MAVHMFKACAVAAIVAAICGASYFWWSAIRGDADDVPRQEVLNPGDTAAISDVHTGVVHKDGPSLSIVPDVNFDPLAELHAANDLRAFSEKAKLHPEQGGIFYAKRAKFQCLTVFDLVRNGDKLPPVRSEDLYSQQDALRKLQNLCANFNAYEVEPQEVLMGSNNGDVLQDSLLSIQRRLSKAKSNEERKAPLLELLVKADPELMRLSLIPVTERGQYFDGEYYPFGASSNIIGEALSLLACDLGERCDSTDFEVVYTCAFQGRCVADRMSLIDLQLKDNPSSQMSLDDVRRLKDRILSAINSRNINAFVPR